MNESLVLLGAAVAAGSGLPGLFLRRHPVADAPGSPGRWLAALLSVVGSGLGLAGVGRFWYTGESEELVYPWAVPGGELVVALDGISALFLAPVFLVSALGAVYGLGYWKHPDTSRKLCLFYGLMAGAMALLLVARNAVLFLFGWEVMALSAFFLVTTEDQDSQVREAGWLYLVATHVATLCLFALFALLRVGAGSFSLVPLREGALSPGLQTAVFVLAVVGFGLKAGIMPLHVWLPSAHAVAPSHVSAVLSGVLIKMGIYGIVRVTSLLPGLPVEWGMVLLGLGAISGVLGVAFAVGQHDLKRLLAYHSIENIGIILIGVGLALVGRSLRQPGWVVLGLAGGLLHVWNHALFKALLFLAAGSVIHATHTREIDHLGGLARAMPRTAFAFLVGAVAICGLPPLNGFVSEFLIYLGLFQTLGVEGSASFTAAALAAPALALIGALAVACFVKVFGAVFLGTGRSQHTAHAHDPGPTMTAPMGVLIACCVVIGLAPALVAPALDSAIRDWAPEMECPPLAAVSPLGWVSAAGVMLLGALALAGGLLWARIKSGGAAEGPTWGCGYLAPTPRIQYTSSSFAQMLVALFAPVLRPRTQAPPDFPLFPKKTEFRSEVPDTVLDSLLLPAFRACARLFSWAQVQYQGSIQTYLLYIFAVLLALLLWR
jgi:hydrogenase-4 component B